MDHKREKGRVDKMKEIYNTLETQILQKQKKQEIIFGGDFNAKLDINQPNAKKIKKWRDNAKTTAKNGAHQNKHQC